MNTILEGKIYLAKYIENNKHIKVLAITTSVSETDEKYIKATFNEKGCLLNLEILPVTLQTKCK